MESVTESPSRALRIGNRLAGVLLALLLAAWVLILAAWGLSRLWVIPHIGELRPRIEAALSSAAGVPVQIGALDAEPNGVLPVFIASDLVVGDASARDALHAKRVVVALSPRALWRGRADRITIEGLDAQVRRLPDGRIGAAGVVFDPRAPSGSGAATAWLFSQPSITVQAARIEWLDEQRGLPAVALSDVNIALRNTSRRHSWRVEATPPAAWGDRLTLAGRFRQRVFSLRSAPPARWDGTVYARWAHFDTSAFAAYLPALPGHVTLGHARGGLQAWIDLRQTVLRGGAVDLALQELAASLVEGAAPLALQDVRGRLSGSRDATGFQLAARGLGFAMGEDLHWPASDLHFTHVVPASAQAARTTVSADRIDLAVLAAFAARLPLPDASRALAAQLAPQGVLRDLQLHWVGPADAPVDYRARGAIDGLVIAAGPPHTPARSSAAAPGATKAAPTAVAAVPGAASPHLHPHPPAGRPGVAGLSGHFDLGRDAGSAEITIDNGQLVFPGVFEEPAIDVARLRAGVRWKRSAQALAVDVDHVSFANADLAGEASIHWHTAALSGAAGAPAAGTRYAPGGAAAPAALHASQLPAAAFPGVLDLGGMLERADGTRVWRYLPLAVGEEARHYVRDAIRAGASVGTRFRVRGDLRNMPFRDPAQGEFHIASQIRGARYAFVPRSIQRAGENPWPLLDDLSGELIFDRAGMEVRNAAGRLFMPTGPAGGLRVSKVGTRIEDFSRSVVDVTAQAQGPLKDMVAVVNASPLADFTGHALAEAQASGAAALSLQLGLPLAALGRSTVQARLTLSGNTVQIVPAQPPLSDVAGKIAFSEKGFAGADLHARFLGGSVQIDGGAGGGSAAGSGGSDAASSLRLRGRADAAALRAAPGLGSAALLLQHLEGSLDYDAQLELQKSGPVLRLNSSLRGLAVDLPPPLGKAADEAMPLRFEGRPLADASAGNRPPGWDLSLSLGDIASAHYELQPASAPGARPAVLRGSIGLGLAADEDAPLPARGVAANLHLDSIDIDRWRSALGAGEPSPAASGSAKPAPTDTGVALEGFLPDTLAVRADRVSFGGRALHHLVAGGSRAGATWRMTLAAEELDGYVEYRAASEPAPAQIYARLARLRVPKAAESEVDRLLDGPATEQSASAWPALDIVVDALELKGRQLGRVAVDAVNRAAPEGRAGEREWELNKLDMQVPEAHFSAKGKWSRKPGAAHPVTALDFQLEIRDSGALLARFGMPGLIRRTPGSLRGTASWRGSPIDPDFTTMDGDLHLDMDAGQFLKAEPGIAKLLGVLSLQSLPRRLVLDFRDVFSEGFAFDWVRGDVAVTSGVARTENLKMKGPAAVVLMEGGTDLHKETQDLHVVVIPQIGAGTASLIAAAINPLVGLASFLAQEILHEPLTRAATREFRITGSWTDPNVVRLRGDDRTGPPGKQR